MALTPADKRDLAGIQAVKGFVDLGNTVGAGRGPNIQFGMGPADVGSGKGDDTMSTILALASGVEGIANYEGMTAAADAAAAATPKVK